MSHRVGVVGFVLSAALVAIGLGVYWSAVSGDPMSQPWVFIASGTLVGGIIVARSPGNRLGWLIFATGLILSGSVATEGYWYAFGIDSPSPSPGAVWGWWYAQMIGATFYVFTFGLPFLFPTGTPPSTRWRWLGWVGVGVAGITVLYWGSAPNLCPLPLDPDAIPMSPNSDCPNPIPSPWVMLSGTARSLVDAVWLPLFLGTSALAVVSMGFRYRNGAPQERAQLKWFALATGVSVVLLVGGEFSGLPEPIVQLAYLAVPTAILLAITRYRLYDIDQIVSRTVTYTLVIALLAAFYTGATVLLTQVLPVDSTLAVAASTLAVAALFTPLRRRIQRVVDRRFNRTRYQAEREVQAFTTRLQDTTHVDTVQADLIDVISRTLQPSTIGVWIRSDPTERHHNPAIP